MARAVDLAPVPGGPKPVSVTWVSNIFDPVASRRTVAAPAGKTIGMALLEFMPLAPPGFEVVAVLNGELLPVARHDLLLLPGDNLVMAARPQGGGGGGSNPLATVAMIAVMVAASVMTYGVSSLVTTGAWGWGMGMAAGASAAGMVAGAVAGAAVIGVGGYLVNSTFKPNQPDFGLGGQEALGASPSYSWQAQANPTAEGTTLPVLYGRFMVTPPMMARYVESAGKTQYLNMQYALAGHQIDAVEAVKINDQPWESYTGTQMDVRLGYVDQEPIPYFSDLREEIGIGAKLTTDWTVREIPGSVQGFALGFAYRLYYANDSGGISPITAYVEAEYRKKGATQWTRYRQSTTAPVTVAEYRWSAGYWQDPTKWVELAAGDTNRSAHTEYEPYYPPDWESTDSDASRTYYFWRWMGAETVYAPSSGGLDYLPLTGRDTNNQRYTLFCDYLPEGSYEIRARLRNSLTEDSRHGSDVALEFIQAIQYDDFTYPCTAVGGLRALATDQISGGLPRVQWLIRRDYVRVYDPIARVYLYKSARNPAWACYDALHNGAVGHPDPAAYGQAVPHTRIVYADFLEWGEWCDKKGYTVDLYFESGLSGKTTLDMLGLLGRGRVEQIGSRFTCIVDKPRELPRQTFLVGLGNITTGSLEKAWLPMQDRANVLELTYFDAEADYQRQTVEIYQDGFDTVGRAEIKAQRTLYGCTDRKAALVFGRGQMLRNRYLTFMPSFETGTEAIHCLPGDLVDLAFDELHGSASGRVVENGQDTLQLDREITLHPGTQYAVSVQHIETDEREYAYVVGVTQTETTDTLLLSKPLQSELPVDSKYAFGEVGRVTKSFTVEKMQTAADQKKRLQLLEYVPEIYDDEVIDVPEVDDAGGLFIRGLKAVEIWQPGGPDGSGRSCIGLSWRGNALFWNVWYREQGTLEWKRAGRATTPNFEIADPLIVGATYEVAVSVGAAETGEKATITLLGKLAPPHDVLNFRAVAQGDTVRFDWDHVPDADLWAYEIRLGVSWNAGQVILDGVTANTAAWNPPMDGTYRFWIKAVDQSGVYSINAADALLTIDISGTLNVVWQSDELPTGVPTADLFYLLPANNDTRVVWVPGLVDTDRPDYTDQSPEITAYTGDYQQGVYTSQIYDIGVETVFDFRMHAEFSSRILFVTDQTVPHRTDQTFPRDTDIHVSTFASYRAAFRCAGEDQAWSDWQEWTSALEITARYLQFRYTTAIDEAGANYAFTRLSGIADVEEQEKIFEADIPAGGLTFAITGIGLRPMLHQPYYVGVTVLGTLPYTPAVEDAPDQFTVRCFDRDGNAHAARVKIEVRGF